MGCAGDVQFGLRSLQQSRRQFRPKDQQCRGVAEDQSLSCFSPGGQASIDGGQLHLEQVIGGDDSAYWRRIGCLSGCP